MHQLSHHKKELSFSAAYVCILHCKVVYSAQMKSVYLVVLSTEQMMYHAMPSEQLSASDGLYQPDDCPSRAVDLLPSLFMSYKWADRRPIDMEIASTWTESRLHLLRFVRLRDECRWLGSVDVVILRALPRCNNALFFDLHSSLSSLWTMIVWL